MAIPRGTACAQRLWPLFRSPRRIRQNSPALLCYNGRRMRMRLPRMRSFPCFLLGICLLFGVRQTHARQSDAVPPAARPALPQEGIFLVFPFENVGASPRLDWIGEGLEELTIQQLSAAGQQVYSHAGRLNQMDDYGLPSSAKLSHATMLHIAQEMDADYIVFGDFTTDGNTMTANARVLRVSPVALLPMVKEDGPLNSLMEFHTRLVWGLLRTCDRNYPLSLPQFSKLQQPLGLAAFEQYIRGLLSNDDDSRLRYFQGAARLERDWPEPAFAMAEVYFQRNDCIAALPWYAKVPQGSALRVEALFDIGVCRLRLSQPDKAVEVFGGLEEDLHRNLLV